MYSLLFSLRDTITFESVIYHGEGSKAEGLPGRVRVITPAYVKYTASDSVESNYSVAAVPTEVCIYYLLSNLIL